MSRRKKITVEEDLTLEKHQLTIYTNNDQSQQDHSTVRIKEEPDALGAEDDMLNYQHEKESPQSVKQEIDHIDPTSEDEESYDDDQSYQGDDTNLIDDIKIKDEITVDEAKVEKYSEFEMKRLKQKCKMCDFRCTTQNSLISHNRVAHPEECTTRCQICFKCFKGILELEKHAEDEHQGLGSKCNICLVEYKTDQSEAHKVECPGRLLFVCSICKTSYVSKGGVFKHLDEHDVSEDLKESSANETRIKERFFTCDICEDDRAYRGKVFKKNTKGKHAGHYLRCPDCRKTFKTSYTRLNHMKKFCNIRSERKGLNEPEVQCPECSKSCKNKYALKVHLTQMHPTNPLQCTECKTKFMNARSLRYHQLKAHIKPSFSCCFCSKKFHYKSALHQHMGRHSNVMENKPQEKFECQKCSKQFLRLANFNAHMKKHDQDKQVKDSKSICVEKGMDKDSQIKQGITIEEAKIQDKSKLRTKSKGLSCNFCDFHCNNRRQLQRHIRKTHPDNGKVLCGICRTMFNGKSELEKHITEAHQGLEKECSICLTRYRRDEEHASKCLGRQLFNCKHCKLSFLKKEGIWKHLGEHDLAEDFKESSIRETRKKEQLYSCVICGDDRAYRKGPLMKHAKDHHDGYHLHCPDCGATFKDNSVRSKHMKMYCKVARERLSADVADCPECSISCKNKMALQHHIAQKHRKKTFPCTECGKNFQTGPNLRYHINKYHMVISDSVMARITSVHETD